MSNIIALNVNNGEVVWQYQPINASASSFPTDILIENDVVYVNLLLSVVVALDLETGEQIWEIDKSDNDVPTRRSGLAYHNNNLYVANHVLNPQNGQVIQTSPIKIAMLQLYETKYWGHSGVYDSNNLDILHTFDDTCYPVPPYSFYNDMAYAVSYCGGIVAISTSDFKQMWSYHSNNKAYRPTAIHQDLLYILFDDSKIHAVDPKNGETIGTMNANNANYDDPVGIFADESLLLIVLNSHQVLGLTDVLAEKK